ncbi:MAG: DUF5063 domain-containing protein [Flavobacteriales bacterium]|nr:DUF5063 domain-containing protein [Flavobacteriales bacterium]
MTELVPVIRSRANDWLTFVHAQTPVTEEDLLQLEALLDRIIVLRHELGPLSRLDLEDGTALAPRLELVELRTHLSNRFPMLGFYNIPEVVSKDLMQTGLMMGDAVDDILDITNDLSEVVRMIEQKRPNEACWTFGFRYDQHWRNHARSLLWYLEQRRRD